MIVNLPVGYGKSIMYQLLPALLEKEADSTPVILVLPPLNVIQKDQLATLNQHGIKACRLDMQWNPEVYEEESASFVILQDKVSFEDVKTGQFSLILCHPEALLNSQLGKDILRDSEFKSKVSEVVIDECHIASEWGKEFRRAYANLHILPCTFPSVPHIALSGSLTVEELKSLPSTLGLNNPVTIEENPDRSNIFLSVKHKAAGRDSQAVYEDIFISECIM